MNFLKKRIEGVEGSFSTQRPAVVVYLSQSLNRTSKPPLIGLVPLRGVTNEVQKTCYCRNAISDFVALIKSLELFRLVYGGML